MSLADIERRSKQKWNPVNNVVFMSAFLILSTSSFVIISEIMSSFSSTISSSDVAPTSIPWINNRYDCQRGERVWRDNKCWDYEHSPMF
jgi:hypothetical protein